MHDQQPKFRLRCTGCGGLQYSLLSRKGRRSFAPRAPLSVLPLPDGPEQCKNLCYATCQTHHPAQSPQSTQADALSVTHSAERTCVTHSATTVPFRVLLCVCGVRRLLSAFKPVASWSCTSTLQVIVVAARPCFSHGLRGILRDHGVDYFYLRPDRVDKRHPRCTQKERRNPVRILQLASC